MKRFIFICAIALFILGTFAVVAFKYKINKDLVQPVYSPTSMPNATKSPVVNNSKTSLSLFVPYWALSEEKVDADGFEKLIYFGIKPDKTGISEEEINQLNNFNELRPADSQAWLAVRMTNSSENLKILDDTVLEQKIIDETITAAEERNMNGIVLDLEISAIPLDALIKQVNKFSEMFYESSKKNGLTYAIALYGDSFYRPRPFDVKTLAQNSDQVMVMAYDFHKAGGSPGPNFPLNGSEKYGYDIGKMADDFLELVPANKITVVFGLFGYDWEVDDKGDATAQGQALTLAQMKHKFANEKLRRDADAGEMQVNYMDDKKHKHVVWFEDMESVKQKEDFLKLKGISSFSYWAYSYY